MSIPEIAKQRLNINLTLYPHTFRATSTPLLRIKKTDKRKMTTADRSQTRSLISEPTIVRLPHHHKGELLCLINSNNGAKNYLKK